MKLHNLRLGLATNSSSTHSIILMPPNHKIKDDGDAVNGEFGWNTFTAASERTKRLYLAAALYQNLQDMVGEDVARACAKDWTGEDPCTDEVSNGYREIKANIDHQSLWALPTAWNGKGVDKQFFDELKNYILNDRIVIVGGNDNGKEDENGYNDANHHLLHDHDATVINHIKIAKDASRDDVVAKKDDPHWVLFQRKSGTKIRFSFNDKAPEYTKSQTPELVDIKITDFCPYDCAYCYQSSTTGGKHADTNIIKNLARNLGYMKTFEVAIGGGEPTLHPNFVEIMHYFRHECNIVPNFTTKNLSWLRDPDIREPIFDVMGAFAFSVTDEKEIQKLEHLIEEYKIDHGRVNLQYVMGTTESEYDFARICKTAAKLNFRLTLLGFKRVGRGKSINVPKYDYWLDVVQKVREEKYLKFGIDTALAAEYDKQLKVLGVPSWCYSTQEGKFSMYVDAVEQMMGPSSYCDPDKMKSLTHKVDELQQIYSKF